MSTLEGVPKGEVEFEAGSQVGVSENEESYSSEDLDRTINDLKAKEHFRLPDVINRLGGNKKATKEKLGHALNMGGLEWGNLERLVTDSESEQAVSDTIVSWAEQVELAADTAAIQKADQALIQAIENF